MAKPGKYAHVIDKLPRMLGKRVSSDEKVEAVKAAIRAEEPDLVKRANELARTYIQIRLEKNRAKELLSEIQVRLEAITELMVEQLEVEGTSALRILNLGVEHSVSTHLKPYASVIDKEAHRLWCIKQGLEHAMVIPWATTNTLTAKMLLAGEPEPDGVKIWAKPAVRATGVAGEGDWSDDE